MIYIYKEQYDNTKLTLFIDLMMKKIYQIFKEFPRIIQNIIQITFIQITHPCFNSCLSDISYDKGPDPDNRLYSLVRLLQSPSTWNIPHVD
jgi:hypothetical protein